MTDLKRNPSDVTPIQRVAQQYRDDGFRILRCSGTDKRPLVGGFGADNPTFTCEPEDCREGERIAILCGECPALDDGHENRQPLGDLLICLDLDHGLTVAEIEAHTGPLPVTATSKGGAHRYYRVPAAQAADLRQWTNVLNAEDPSKGALDLKWKGGYAIEPGYVDGGWDDGFDAFGIEYLPERAIRAFVELKASKGGARERPEVEVDETARVGDIANGALIMLWPSEGRFDAALALGGVLAGSLLSEKAALDFANDVLAAAGCERIRQVEVSFQNARSGADVEIKGWPTLRKALDVDGDPTRAELFRQFVDGIPWPEQKRDASAAEFTEKLMNDPQFCAPVIPIRSEDDSDVELESGDSVGVGTHLLATRLRGAVFAEGGFYKLQADGFTWAPLPAATVRCWIHDYSQVVYGYTERGVAQKLQISGRLVSDVVRHCEDELHNPTFFDAPGARIAFQNGVLDLATGELVEATPEHKIRHVLPFDYDPDALTKAPPTEWSKFVLGQWKDDQESIQLLHQILGYLLSGRQDLETMFVLLGPPRSGKGTIIKLLTAIMGDAVGSFKVSALAETFGMSSMVGKSVLVDPDVRASRSVFRDTGAVAEKLLSITSAESQPIRRMRQEPVDCVLPGRILMASNPPFHLADEGGALASRITVLGFSVGHVGTEDRGLLGRLKAEIPGIVALALQGLQTLNETGRFVEPTASADVRNEIRLGQEPMLEWWDDCCSVIAEADEGVTVAEAFQKASIWRDTQGLRPFSSRALGAFLSSQGVKSRVVRRSGRPVRIYPGLKIDGAA